MKSLKIKHGGASSGIAIGHAHIFSSAGPSFPKHWIADKEITSEISRFKHAIQKSRQQLGKIKEKLCRFEGKEQIQILDTHSMLLQDEMLITHAIQNIANQKINAEWALDKATSRLKMAFIDMRDEYFQQRKYDIDYIHQRIMKNLTGMPELPLHEIKDEDIILIAADFSPADIVNFPRDRVKGFITSIGGNTSHTAIIARSLEIPAMVGVEKIINHVQSRDVVVIDALKGLIIINPGKKELSQYKKNRAGYEKAKIDLLKDINLPAETRDGAKISLVANIELVEEIKPALSHGAEGIGLFRTEYLYANRMDYPSEEEQFECYKTALSQMKGKSVTIRTFDLGGDKLFGGGEYADHINPALGLRAVRFCLAEKELFKTQLRALLRSSVYGNLRLLLPMISGIEELSQVKTLIEDVKAGLKKKNIPVNPNIELGIMIEIPSAVIVADALAKEVSFFSIGTNDLIQYTLAVDRTNEHVSYLYNLLNPAVIEMIKKTAIAAKNANIDVTVCGEAAGDPLYLMLFLGLGVDALSMNPVSIPRVKKLLRTVTAKEARELVQKIEKAQTTAKIESLLKSYKY
ncbi:MAG: phosphoenolpyruvate--protein phosphotransferase [Deltaproteobacteria bacterium]|nr:phosphoenolpyruvate--protein phosphotransferase [Deltaproteobacteria bacterium]